ncbi:MAG: GAF domain-containing protein, partial [Chlorobiales bacterium]|nr:GAF domain-containing protein [Chlorobiales bacterium]
MEIRQTETHLSVIQYISDAIGTIRDKKELFRVITDKLRLLFKFDAAGIITLDKKQEHIQLFFESLSRVDEAFISYMAQKRPIEGTPFKEFLENPRIFSLDLQEYSRQIPESNVVVELYKAGFRQVTHVPLRSRGRVIGFLNLLFFTQNDWSKDDLRLLEKISSQIAIAVSNVLAYEEIRKREAEKELQLAVNNALLNIKARDKMMLTVAEQIDKVFSWSFLGIRIFKPDGEPLMYDLFRKDTAGKISPVPNFYTDTASSPVVSLSAYTTQKIYSENDLAELSQQNPIAKLAREKYGVRSYMIVPLWNDPKGIAAIALAHMQPNAFKDEHMAILQTIAPQISLALQNFLAFEQIESLR